MFPRSTVSQQAQPTIARVKTALVCMASAFVLGACSNVPSTPRPTSPAQPPTNVPAPATAKPTPAPNYRELRTRLVGPLSSMIVSLRQGDTRNAAAFLAEFNQNGDAVLTAIKDDTSVPASLLQSAIISVRTNASDIPTLEEVRRRLLTDIT